MTVGFAVPTRGMHPHLEQLVALYSQFGPVLILDPNTRHAERYASWFNQAIQWATDQGLDGLVFSNDDILPTWDTIRTLIDGLNGHDLASQNRADNNWDFSADFFATRINPNRQLWMDESYGFHWADLDMALRARTLGYRHALLELDYNMRAYEPHEPKGHLAEFARHTRADEMLRDSRWGWLLNGEVKHP